MAALTGTQISVTYVGLLKTSASTVLSSTAQQMTDGSGNNSILYLSTAEVGIGGSPTAGKELDVTGNVLITGDLQVDNININGNTISATSGVVTLSNGTIATTQSQNDNSTKVATTAYVDTAIDGVDTLGEVLSNGDTTDGNNIVFGDSATIGTDDTLIFGAGNDLRIAHNGTDSVIRNYTGGLYIDSDGADRNIHIRNDDGSGSKTDYMVFNGAVGFTINYKLQNFQDNVSATFGNGSDLQIYHDGSNSYIKDTGTGSLLVKTGSLLVRNPSDASMIDAQSGGAVNLYYNNSKKFETTTNGVEVTGTLIDLDSSANATVAIDRGATSNDAIVSWRNAGSEYFKAGLDGTDNNLWSLLHTCGSGLYFDGSNMRFGINTDSPQAKLEITTLRENAIRLSSSDVTAVTDELLSGIEFYSPDTSGGAGVKASIQVKYNDNDANSYMTFSTGTNTERMRIDSSGNIGVGVTPESWGTAGDTKAIQISTMTSLSEAFDGTQLASNFYFDGTNDKYIQSDFATAYLQIDGTHRFRIAASGTADANITWSEAMRIDSSGNVGISTTNPINKLGVKTATNTNERAINIYSGTTTADNYVSIGSQYSETNGLVNSEIRFGNENTAGANSYLAFAAGSTSSPTERMRIDSSGQVIFKGTGNGIDLRFADISAAISSQTAGYIGMSTSAYSGNNGDLVLIPRTSAASNILLMQGSVGIGETSPASDLVVRSDSAGGRGGEISIVNYATSTVGNEAALNFGLENSTYNADNGNAQIKARVNNASSAATDMIFSLWSGTSFNERMRITSGGNVNIGIFETGSGTVTGPLVVTHNSARFLTASYEESIVSLNSKNNSNNLESFRLAGDNIQFWTGSNASGTERMRINSSGNVGIGSNSPDYGKLQVDTSSGNNITIRKGTGTPALTFGGTNANEAIALQEGIAGGGLSFYTGTGTLASPTWTERMRIESDGTVQITNSTSPKLQLKRGAKEYTTRVDNNNKFVIQEEGGNEFFVVESGASSNSIRIDSSGRVGINETSLSGNDAKLIIDSADGKHPAIKVNNGNANGFTMLADNYTATESQFNIGVGYSGAQGVISQNCKVSDAANNTFLSSNAQGATKPMALSFDAGDFIFRNTNTSATTAVDTAVTLTERMRVTSDGYSRFTSSGSYKFGSGYDFHEFVNDEGGEPTLMLAHTGTGNPTCYGLNVIHDSTDSDTTGRFFLGATNGGATEKIKIYTNGNVQNANNSYGQLSDRKLKENIEDATPKLDDLMQVQIKNFNYIDDETKQIGVIAQELEDIFPALVYETPDTERQDINKTDEEGNIIYQTEQVLVSEAVEGQEAIEWEDKPTMDNTKVEIQTWLDNNEIEWQSADTKQELLDRIPEYQQEAVEAQDAVYETRETDEPVTVNKEVDLGTTTKAVKYSVFVPIMIKAMQEQQQIIEDLKARIEALEN